MAASPFTNSMQHASWPWLSQGVYVAYCHVYIALPACAVPLTLLLPCSFVTFEEESSVDDCFNYGSHHELAGKKVEVKSATPRGSGPVGPSTGRGSIGQRGPLPERPGFGPRQGQAYPFPGPMGTPNYSMQFPAMARWASMAACIGAVPRHVGLADFWKCLSFLSSRGHQALHGLPADQATARSNLQIGDFMLCACEGRDHFGRPSACTANPPGQELIVCCCWIARAASRWHYNGT